jgi:glyoxylase-like metal-dependent hydrolase (beta-lactamase superfamily II)
LKLKHFPHNNPLVIRANIGKNSVHFFGNDVGWILVDTGTSADIITWRCFVQMGFTEKDLKKLVYTLIGFEGKKIEAVGKAEINVTFGQGATMRLKQVTFDIVDVQYPYKPSSREI